MAWSALVPTQPPDVEAMLKDQTNRWNKVYANMPQPAAVEDQFDWDSLLKGNMFFTGQGNDPAEEHVTGRNRNPFMWGTGNDSLQDAYKATYDAYYKGAPSATTSYYDTWEGPDIRSTIGADGTPTYWQDNNQNQSYNFSIDDSYVPTGNEGNTASPAYEPTVINTVQPTPEKENTTYGGLRGMFNKFRDPSIWDEESVWDVSQG